MKTLAPGITVNGIKITPDQINAEVQYHPACSLLDAKYEAMQALVIRELLIQRAANLGLCLREEAVRKPDDIIDALLEQEIDMPESERIGMEKIREEVTEEIDYRPSQFIRRQIVQTA